MVNLNEPQPPCYPMGDGVKSNGPATETPQAPILVRLNNAEGDLSELKNKLSQILTEHENRLSRLEGRMGI